MYHLFELFSIAKRRCQAYIVVFEDLNTRYSDFFTLLRLWFGATLKREDGDIVDQQDVVDYVE